jgi:hypothetical protein
MRTTRLILAGTMLALSLPTFAQTAVVRPEDQAAYDYDMEVYRAEVRATNRLAQSNAELAARQERAYADAMRAWRIQVADCRRGIIAACRAPTPRPGDFM